MKNNHIESLSVMILTVKQSPSLCKLVTIGQSMVLINFFKHTTVSSCSTHEVIL